MADKELEQGLEELESVKQTFKSNIGAKGISTSSIEFRNYPSLINQMEKILPSQTKTVNPTTSEQSVSADSGYKLVRVKVNAVKPSDYYKPEEIANVTPTTSDQEINPTNGAVFSKINVSAVTSDIDANIQEENIKEGVTILGKTGTYRASGGGVSSAKFGELVDGSITTVEESDLADVEEIRPSAFENITTLQSVAIPSNVTTIGANAFNGCTGVTSLSLVEGVQTIGANAFNGVSATFEIPRSLVNVGEGAFANNTAITSMTIPSTLTTLSANMFNGCTNLTEITMESTTPPSVTSTTFPSNITSIYVPYGAYDSYKTSWSSYASKIVRLPAIPSTIIVTVNDYNGELVIGASVTISGNGQTYTGSTDSSGVFTQGDLQPATYTITVSDLDEYRTPDAQEIVVEEDTINSATITYLEKSSINPVFGQNTPEIISQVADEIATKGMTSAEVKQAYGWGIGDTYSWSNSGTTYQVRIIGFNHDDLSSGLGKAGITLEMTHCITTTYRLASNVTLNTNKGGILATSNYNTICANAIASNLNHWRNYVQFVDKKYANGGKTNYSETLTMSSQVFFLSEVEIDGTGSYAQDGANEGTQYEYYVGLADKRKKKTLGYSGSDVAWWLRSCYYASTSAFCTINTNGGVDINDAYGTSIGVSFAFCVGAPQPSRTFSENSPSVISAISSQISANNMTSSQVAETYGWNIGDTISYDLTTGENVEMRIIGFNHDDKSDGTGKAGITLEMTHCLSTQYSMNSESTNAGGYPASELRNSTLPMIKTTLPTKWQNVIKRINKSSANGGDSNYSEVLITSEDLFIISFVELFGGTSSSTQSATDEGNIYEYHNANNNNTARKRRYDSNSDNIPDAVGSWWTRSCPSSQTTGFRNVNTSGYLANNPANWAGGRISYAFCI